MMPWSLSDELCRLLSGPLGLGASSKVCVLGLIIIIGAVDAEVSVLCRTDE